MRKLFLSLIMVLATNPTACAHANPGAPQPGDRVFVMTADIVGSDGKSALARLVPDDRSPSGQSRLLMFVNADACAGFNDPTNDDPCPVKAKRPPGAKLPIERQYEIAFKHTFAVAPDFHDVLHFQLAVYRHNPANPGKVDIIPQGYTIRCEIIEQGKAGTIAANSHKITSAIGSDVEAVCDINFRV